MITLELLREDVTDAEGWRAVGLSRAGLGRFLRVAQGAVGLEGEVEVLLAGDKTLRRLNREFRGKNKATDVLSFPGVPGTGHGGDMAVSLETAGRQAREHGHSLRDEVRVLLLHGVLHLAGHDHEVDAGEMAELEGRLRKRLGLPGGLIERTGVRTGVGEKQIPFEDDRKKSKSKKQIAFENDRKKSKGRGVAK
jgi:probable rRNA maturation factor